MDCLRSIPIVTAFCLTLASTVAAQPARLPPIESPVVHPDRTFNDDLVGSIMPYVETHFRASPDREKRAIAGFSRGGGQSLFAGFSNLDKFAHVGSYSAYLTPEVVQKYFGEVVARPEATNRQLKLLWLGVGKSDFLYQPAVAFDKLMTDKQIMHTFLVTEGGHTWMNARHYLTETLQLYFK